MPTAREAPTNRLSSVFSWSNFDRYRLVSLDKPNTMPVAEVIPSAAEETRMLVPAERLPDTMTLLFTVKLPAMMKLSLVDNVLAAERYRLALLAVVPKVMPKLALPVLSVSVRLPNDRLPEITRLSSVFNVLAAERKRFVSLDTPKITPVADDVPSLAEETKPKIR